MSDAETRPSDEAPAASTGDDVRPDDEAPAVLGAAAPLSVDRSENRRRRRRPSGAGGPAPRAMSPIARSGPLGDYSDIVYVFEPNVAGVPPLRPYVSSLWQRRHLMLEMARADLRTRESRTALGRLWWILDPLLLAAIYFMLFSVIRQGPHSLDHLHALVAGIFLFTLSSSALSDGSSSIRAGKQLLFNSDFPRAMLPLITVVKGLIRFAPTLAVYPFIHLALDAPIGRGIVLLPVLFVVQLTMMVGMALFAATVTVFFQDAQNAISYATRLLFFATPVIYPASMLSERMQSILAFQPFYSLFAAYQSILEGGVPTAFDLVVASAWAVGWFLFGAWLFLRYEREFAIRL